MVVLLDDVLELFVLFVLLLLLVLLLLFELFEFPVFVVELEELVFPGSPGPPVEISDTRDESSPDLQQRLEENFKTGDPNHTCQCQRPASFYDLICVIHACSPEKGMSFS